MANRLSGRAKTVADSVCLHIKTRLPQYPSANQQRRRLGQLISELAGFPIEPDRLVGNVPGWVVEAVRGRRTEHLGNHQRPMA